MKKVLNVLTLFVFLFGAACTAVKEPVAVDSPEADLSLGQESEVQDEEAEEKQPEVEPVTVEPVEEVSIDYAQNFTLEYFEGYKLLTVTQPWIGAEQSFSYALVPEESVGMVDVGGNAMVIPTPPSKASSPSQRPISLSWSKLACLKASLAWIPPCSPTTRTSATGLRVA